MSEPVGPHGVLVKAEGCVGGQLDRKGESQARSLGAGAAVLRASQAGQSLGTVRSLALGRRQQSSGSVGWTGSPCAASQVYKGYVDDPRNTDNAWIETVAVSVHFPDQSDVELKRLNSVWGSGCRLRGRGDAGPAGRGLMGTWARARAG